VKVRETMVIRIPKGKFCGNCSGCVYANFYKKDSQGRVYCSYYGNYNHPSDRNGCFNFKN